MGGISNSRLIIDSCNWPEAPEGAGVCVWGGVLPYKRLMGMCRCMGSNFHHWIDYDGVTHFLIFGGKKVLYIYGD